MRRFLLPFLLLIAAGAAKAGPIGPFSDVVVFGDSYSDPGNAFLLSGGTIPDPLFYPSGQFTNGDVWTTQLGLDVASGRNFAVGGAKAQTDLDPSPDFLAQILAFDLAAPDLGDNPLVAIFLGGNDLRDATPVTLPAVIDATVDALEFGISALIGQGLDNFLLLNLPNLGRFPELVGTPESAFATAGTIEFNMRLAGIADTFAPLADIEIFDTFSLFETFAISEAANGTIVDVSCENDLLNCDPLNAGTHLFFDDVHVTEGFHTALAGAVRAQIVPLPQSAVLLLGACLLGAGLARRRRP